MDVSPPLPAHETSDDALAGVARLLRRFHDRQVTEEPGTVLCHNDVRPGTVVFVDQVPLRLTPSPWAAPGPRRWDVAGAVWRWVPLLCDWDAAELGFDTDFERRGTRLRAFCDAYGLPVDERLGLFDEVEQRLEVADAIGNDERFSTIEGWAALRAERGGEGVARDRWWVTEFRDRLEPWLMP